ncbi:MAG: PHB depolymerase family esterase [Syntrophales bacterium]
MHIIRLKLLGCIIALALIAACNTTQSAAQLPALSIDPAEVSVSGLSSGGFMAVQAHVAYSGTFKRGAGIVAGGPFYCSEGSPANTIGRCMAHSSAIPVPSLVNITNAWAAGNLIDPVSNLSASKVYLFSGTADNTVKAAVMDDLQAYYGNFVPDGNTFYKNTLASGHAMITDDFGGSCATTAPPFINDCDFDLAGEMLKHLYGRLNARNNGALSGSLTEFDQTAFISGHGMAKTGWVYVPQACATGATCKLHVVFHGCKQNTATVDQQFVRNTGYNRWADTNNIVVLYPQTSTAAPNGCWDWWGYDSANFAQKSGPQLAAVKAMVTRLSGAAAMPPAARPVPAGGK